MKRHAIIYLLIYLVIVAHNIVPHHHAHLFILNSYKISTGSLQEVHESHTSDYEFSIHAKHAVKRTEKKSVELTTYKHFILAEIHNLFFENKEKECILCYTTSYLRLIKTHRIFAFLRPPPYL